MKEQLYKEKLILHTETFLPFLKHGYLAFILFTFTFTRFYKNY